MTNLQLAMSIRASRAPLTMDQIRQVAPSAFAAEPYHGMSSRYAYVPTSQVIEGMMQAGFQPFAASQSRTKIQDKREQPMLAENPEQALRMAVAGRRLVALKEARTFDRERLGKAPLFKMGLF